jgi:hypothetical protein
MNPLIERLSNQIAQCTEGLSGESLAWHPEGKWSIGEILEHLSLTYTGTKRVFDRCLQAGKAAATEATFKDRLGAFLVTRVGYLPNGRQAPAPTLPKGRPGDAVLSAIGDDIAGMDDAIQRCEERFGSDLKLVNHPILGPLSAAEWRRFHCVHGRHHLRQIRRLRCTMASHASRA